MYFCPESISDVSDRCSPCLVAAVLVHSTASASFGPQHWTALSCTVPSAESPNVAPRLHRGRRSRPLRIRRNLGTTRSFSLTSWRAYTSKRGGMGRCARRGLSIAFWGADGFPTRPGRYRYCQIRQCIIDAQKFISLSAKEERVGFIRAAKAGERMANHAIADADTAPRGPDLVPVHRFLGADEPGTIQRHFYSRPIEIAA